MKKSISVAASNGIALLLNNLYEQAKARLGVTSIDTNCGGSANVWMCLAMIQETDSTLAERIRVIVIHSTPSEASLEIEKIRKEEYEWFPTLP